MTRIDRTNWPAGRWDGEPDRVEWRVGDFYCIVNRTKLGHWCGYLGVPAGHKWDGQDYDAIHDMEPDLEVHGGLTWARRWKNAPDVPDRFMVGFDCAHAGTVHPSIWDWLVGSKPIGRSTGPSPTSLPMSGVCCLQQGETDTSSSGSLTVTGWSSS
jgi:hypothetical protein